ncbi:MAG: phosphomannomutase/phosphoglucomutase [Clostridia bacterium]|nr:phosphomannomutase/phosphoglucomutase [Clostridia bacterium]
MDNLLYLKSGTDIRGTAIEKEGKDIDLTDTRLSTITASYVNFLKCKLGKDNLKITVGYDSRVSSERISRVVTRTLADLGVKVYDCGLSSTPSMFMSIINFAVDSAVMITASHLPMEMNGLKFFTRQGGFSGNDIKEILSYAEKNEYQLKSETQKAEKLDNMKKYCKDLCDMIKEGVNAPNYDRPLENLKIVVDAGNGVGAFYAEKVLAVLGADISGSCYLEPDGRFPNHIPNPENKQAMQSICDAVKKANADLGVIFDTDCDRAACVDKNAQEINRNKLVALAAYIALKDNKGGIIVTDSVTSDGLAEFIEKDLGGVHHRFKRGYKNVIDEAIRLENEEKKSAPLAIETSGHAAFKENYYLDDGAYLITKIIIEAAKLNKEGKQIEDIISSLKTPVEEKEIRFTIKLDDFREYGLSVINDFKALCEKTEEITVSPVNYEGVRVNFDEASGDGWQLLRMSVHEPLLVLNCESNKEGGVNKMLTFFKAFIEKYDKLDLSKLVL